MSLFDFEKSASFTKLRILGICIYHKYKYNDVVVTRVLGGLFRSTSKNLIITRRTLGIRRKTLNIAELEKQLFLISRDVLWQKENIGMQFAIANHHSKVFPKYSNIHSGKSAVIVATGPTMASYFPEMFSDSIHVAVKAACKREDIDFKYWFSIDFSTTEHLLPILKSKGYTKFFGQCCTSIQNHIYCEETGLKRCFHVPDTVINSIQNSEKFYFSHPTYEICRDIESQPLPDCGSSVFSAIYFMLFTGVKKIYLVGCDCSNSGYFDSSKQTNSDFFVNASFKGWQAMKSYISCFFPDVEIISVNPVGLKGMFVDKYF